MAGSRKASPFPTWPNRRRNDRPGRPLAKHCGTLENHTGSRPAPRLEPSSRNRHRHGSVFFPQPCKLGWGPSRKQRGCWQAKQRQDRKGSPWLRRVLYQAAWAAPHTKGTQFRRFTDKRGKKGAINGVAHTILVIEYPCSSMPATTRNGG
jgi:hypothetical protein